MQARVLPISFLFSALFVCSTLGFCSEPNKTGSQNINRSPVALIPLSVLNPKSADKETAKYLQDYYVSLRDWGLVVQEQVQAVPGKPTYKYLGLPRNIEDHVRPTAYAAMVLSFLSETSPPEQLLSEAKRSSMRADAIALLRYLTHSHRTGGGACVNGKPWGKQWQSAMWSRAACFAGWQLWPHLDKELQEDIIKMLSFEADRFVGKKPKSSVHNDTGAEENAWNASICSLACNMLPNHPHAKDWETAAKNYMYNTFSVKADAKDKSLGDDRRPIQDWVTTVNAHDDFTVENHSLVHVGYLKNSACMIQENAVHWVMMQKTIPLACDHHLPEVFQVLCACMNWNGSAIYFAGNDWKLYETQAQDIVLYCMMSLVSQNANAAHLEQTALKQLRKQQLLEEGFYNGRRDLEYGGLCATRLIACYYAHAAKSLPEKIASEEEFNKATHGVLYLPSAKSILHRTSSKFVSFAWAQKRMGLTIPSKNLVVWPHYASYLGVINGKDASQKFAKLTNIEVKKESDSFAVTGSLLRCKGKLTQDFYFASPAGNYTVYVERLRPKKGLELKSRETGVIGMNPLIGQNAIVIAGDFGEKEIQGRGGEKTVHSLNSNWLNIDNTIGYIVLRPTANNNTLRIHDNTNYHPRRPHLQEWISLIGDEELKNSQEPEWACVVTFVNQNAQETKANQSSVQFNVQENSATVQVGKSVHKIVFE